MHIGGSEEISCSLIGLHQIPQEPDAATTADLQPPGNLGLGLNLNLAGATTTDSNPTFISLRHFFGSRKITSRSGDHENPTSLAAAMVDALSNEWSRQSNSGPVASIFLNVVPLCRKLMLIACLC
jgi:hypothetical protein